MLLERSDVLADLQELRDRAGQGLGAMVVLSGEAGIGKTSVVRALFDDTPAATRRWLGACDRLANPTPLGPLLDVAEQDRRVQALVDNADPQDIPGQVRRLLGTPTIVAFEDVHWMDEATADLLVFLGRRIAQTRALVVVTHRDEVAEQSSPLTRFLSATATAEGVHRARLEPLGATSVARMSEATPVDSDELYRRTGGNPFFVTEVIASGSRAVPATVAQVVLDRVDRLSPTARELVDLASLASRALEVEIIEKVVGAGTGPAIDEAAGLALVDLVDGRVQFRHDLAKSAVAGSVAPAQRLEAQRQLLVALEERAGTDPARLAHHAAQVGDAERLRVHAPVAAREAYRRGAPRAAAAHVESVLALGDQLALEERADLLDLHVDVLGEYASRESMLQAHARAVAAWEQAGNRVRQARQIARTSGTHFNKGDLPTALDTITRARQLVDGLPMDPDVADIVATHASMLSHMGHPSQRAVAEVVVPKIETVEAPQALATALAARGEARICAGDVEAGIADGWRAVTIAKKDAPNSVIRFASNFAFFLAHARQLGDARSFVRAALEEARRRDQLMVHGAALAVRAWIDLRGGDYDGAVAHAEAIEPPDGEGNELTGRAVMLGACHVRTGDPGAGPFLRRATDHWATVADLYRLRPLAVARAEHAWLRDDAEAVDDATALALHLAREQRHAWAAGELLHWRWRAGIDDGPPPDWIAAPWRLLINGRWQEAAEAWKEFESPFEQALALADGDEDAQRRALDLLTQLGARPMADRVRAGLREAGVTDLPVRPRTYGNRLTDRQLEVLALVAEGLTNAEIGQRLYISPKTASNHVSATLKRLDVNTRTEAAAVAIQDGLLDS